MDDKKFVSLSRLKKSGGPSVNTMQSRIRDGKYPKAVRSDGHWFLTADDAVKTLADWNAKKESVSLADVALACGLKKTSLNLYAITGRIQAFCVMGRWFVETKEIARLKEYYLESIDTSEAARRLGYSHRRSIHDLMKRGLAFVQIGTERRIRIRDVDEWIKLNGKHNGEKT